MNEIIEEALVGFTIDDYPMLADSFLKISMELQRRYYLQEARKEKASPKFIPPQAQRYQDN